MNRVPVAVETPAHAGLGSTLDSESEQPLAPGTLVRVPLGRRQVPGIVWPGEPEKAPAGGQAESGFALRGVTEALASLPPLPPAWCRLVEFSARYYQRALGEVALAVLPPELRKLDDAGLAKRMRLQDKRAAAAAAEAGPPPRLIGTSLRTPGWPRAGALRRAAASPPAQEFE